jgi:hypothetical protein
MKFICSMSEKLEKRKNAFKGNQLNSTERIKKQSEQLRKEKRTANVLAKRLKTDLSASSDGAPAIEYSMEFISEGMAKVKVCGIMTIMVCILGKVAAQCCF